MMDKVITSMSRVPGHRSTHALIQPILPAHLFRNQGYLCTDEIDDYPDDGGYISERTFMNQSVAT